MTSDVSPERTPRQQTAARAIANILLETKAVNFRPEEHYTLTAGWASPVYIDCRWLISFPAARRTITLLAREEIEQTMGLENLDTVAGGETAGIPYAAWISDTLSVPMQYVRKKPKGEIFRTRTSYSSDVSRNIRLAALVVSLFVEAMTFLSTPWLLPKWSVMVRLFGSKSYEFGAGDPLSE